MTFIERLRQLLGFTSSISPDSFQVSTELRPLLEHVAAQEGRSLDALIDDLLHLGVSERLVAVENLQHWRALTPREQQAAALACLGYTNQEIAARMVISPNTVRTHMRNILYKFNANSKVELQNMLAGWDFRPWVAGQDLHSAAPLPPTSASSDGINT